MRATFGERKIERLGRMTVVIREREAEKLKYNGDSKDGKGRNGRHTDGCCNDVAGVVHDACNMLRKPWK